MNTLAMGIMEGCGVLLTKHTMRGKWNPRKTRAGVGTETCKIRNSYNSLSWLTSYFTSEVYTTVYAWHQSYQELTWNEPEISSFTASSVHSSYSTLLIYVAWPVQIDHVSAKTLIFHICSDYCNLITTIFPSLIPLGYYYFHTQNSDVLYLNNATVQHYSKVHYYFYIYK